MLDISFMQNILRFVYFIKYVEDWFGYGKLNVLSSFKCRICKF